MEVSSPHVAPPAAAPRIDGVSQSSSVPAGTGRESHTSPAQSPASGELQRPRASPHPFWIELFGNAAPVEIEIGSGDGTFLCAAAERDPKVNLLGIENAYPRARRAETRVRQLGSARVRVLKANATCVVETLVPASSVRAYHLYFPDPWPKHRHAKRRLVTALLVRALARTLVPDGRLFLATDVHGYGWLMRGRILADPRFEEFPVDEWHGGLLTAFARKYRARGRRVFLAAFRRRPD